MTFSDFVALAVLIHVALTPVLIVAVAFSFRRQINELRRAIDSL